MSLNSAPPLHDVRVIDLTDESAVFAGRLLADLGADVVRVEPPDGGRLRRLAPFLGDVRGPERSLQHLYHNAGKRSVVLDRKTAEGQGDFSRLVAGADILFETEALADKPLRDLNPGLIHVTVTPFGLQGDWSKRRGNDLIASASGGLAWVCGAPRDPPNQPGADQSYKMAGLAAATGALIAFHGRGNFPNSGGTHLDISMQECVAITMVQTTNPAVHHWTGLIPKRPGLTTVHRTKDEKYLTLMVRPDRVDVFLDWAREAGLDVPKDKADFEKQVKGVPRSHTLIRELVGKYSRAEFFAKAWDLDILGLPVNTLPEMLECDHLIETKQFIDIKHKSLGVTLSFPRSPVDGIHEAAIGQAPALGEHSKEILQDIKSVAFLDSAQPLDMAQALKGIRVVDFTWVIAGPLGTRILANFGAEVIRVESGRRAFPDRFAKGSKDPSLGGFHNVLNTQKLSITLDPRTPRGRELLLGLIRTADVVTNNYRPGAMDEMGFDYETLKKANPKIISLHMPGCGLKGPWRNRGSFGNMAFAAAGLSYLTGFPDRAPRGLGVAYPDFSCPYLLAMMILAALRNRSETGQGREIDLNQLSATVGFIGLEWVYYRSTGNPPPPRANRDPNWCPHGIYKAKGEDEWLALAVEDDGQWAALCKAMGQDSLADQERFSSHEMRKSHEDELDALISGWSRNLDKWKAAELLQAGGIPAAAVENIHDAMNKDPHLARHYQFVTQPSAPDEAIPINGEAIQVAGKRRALGRAPTYGQDNEYVLHDILGLSKDEIEELRREKILR